MEKAKSEDTATTIATVATVTIRLFRKMPPSGLSRMTVMKLSKVTGHVKSAASKACAGVLSPTDSI
ncbi:hypothetical protein D3C86_2260800 [compost metagenome]